jgi:hypothetical protein
LLWTLAFVITQFSTMFYVLYEVLGNFRSNYLKKAKTGRKANVVAVLAIFDIGNSNPNNDDLLPQNWGIPH